MWQSRWEKSRIPNHMIQKKPKLFLCTIPNALVTEWIMLEKISLHFPIQDDLGFLGGGGLDTRGRRIACILKMKSHVFKGSSCAMTEVKLTSYGINSIFNFLCEVVLTQCITDRGIHCCLICKNKGATR